MQRIEYKVVHQHSLDKFEKEVNKYLKNGWELLGTTHISESFDDEGQFIDDYYYQTMVKVNREPAEVVSINGKKSD